MFKLIYQKYACAMLKGKNRMCWREVVGGEEGGATNTFSSAKFIRCVSLLLQFVSKEMHLG